MIPSLKEDAAIIAQQGAQEQFQTPFWGGGVLSEAVGKTIKDTHIKLDDCLITFTDATFIALRAVRSWDDIALEVCGPLDVLDYARDVLVQMEIAAPEEIDPLAQAETARLAAAREAQDRALYEHLKSQFDP